AEPERGGAEAWTTARMRVSSDNRLDPGWVERQQMVSNGLSDLARCEQVEAGAPQAIEFLEEHGVGIEHVTEERVFMDWNTDGNFAQPVGGGKAIVDGLADSLAGFEGAEILYETEAVRLSVAEDGAIDGIVVRGADGLMRTISAGSVAIASGGFEGNYEMLTKYMGPAASSLKPIAPGIASNTGIGLQMALDVGAATSGSFGGMHSELVDRRTDRPDAVIYTHNLGIVVNDDCERFIDEGRTDFTNSFEVIADEVWRNQNQSAYFITDQQIMDLELDWVFDSDLPPVQADTIAGLAGGLGLDPAALEGTVKAFNEACSEGELDIGRFDGLTTEGLKPDKTNWAVPVDKAPFYAYPLTTAITFTYGGLKTDTETRVLSTHDVPIPNLYA
ncbi:MAG: FAD-binding protein, partial [Myxococcota bacterium]